MPLDHDLADLRADRAGAAAAGDFPRLLRTAARVAAHIADTRPAYRVGSEEARVSDLLDRAGVSDWDEECGWLSLGDRVALLIESRDDARNSADTYQAERDDARAAAARAA